MTLLLGPPGSGKTTLLLALSNKMDKALKVGDTWKIYFLCWKMLELQISGTRLQCSLVLNLLHQSNSDLKKCSPTTRHFRKFMHIPLPRSIMVQIDSCQFASSERSEKLVYFAQVSGKVTYNGHEMHEFVPQRTCAYISQRDLQMGELTVRETLDFSGRCQGVGPKFGEQNYG